MIQFSKMTLKEIGKTLLGWFGVATIIAVVACSSLYGILAITQENYTYTIFKSKAELNYYSSKNSLVRAIDNYIDSIATNSAINGIALLEKCDQYNVDVRFAMAQAQVEGHFATQGIAGKTHSAFNVMAYDGKPADEIIADGHGYNHPDESIEPYLKVLTKDYLVGEKTEMDLLDKFVNKDGQRYASSDDYEQQLRSAYQMIVTKTNISVLYAEYQKYKMICGK